MRKTKFNNRTRYILPLLALGLAACGGDVRPVGTTVNTRVIYQGDIDPAQVPVDVTLSGTIKDEATLDDSVITVGPRLVETSTTVFGTSAGDNLPPGSYEVIRSELPEGYEYLHASQTIDVADNHPVSLVITVRRTPSVNLDPEVIRETVTETVETTVTEAIGGKIWVSVLTSSSAGRKAGGVRVTISTNDAQDNPVLIDDDMTVADQTLVFEGLQPGRYEVQATLDGFVRRVAVVNVLQGRSHSVQMFMTAVEPPLPPNTLIPRANFVLHAECGVAMSCISEDLEGQIYRTDEAGEHLAIPGSELMLEVVVGDTVHIITNEHGRNLEVERVPGMTGATEILITWTPTNEAIEVQTATFQVIVVD